MKCIGSLVVCECEHSSHFKDSNRLTPNGNLGHRYGMAFTWDYITTINRTWTVCKDCAKDCHSQEPEYSDA